jgi:uncharacterized protein YbjQ (UPF0145 family)
MTRLLAILFASIFIAACGGGGSSSVVVGDTSPMIQNWESVTITNVMPEGARTIALVKASSSKGNQQRSVNHAINELKQQAARVGANTVVINETFTEISVVGVPVYNEKASGGLIGSKETEVIEGIAVYVDREQKDAQYSGQAVEQEQNQGKLGQVAEPDKYERLLQLGQLRDKNVITEAEFQELKRRILAEK